MNHDEGSRVHSLDSLELSSVNDDDSSEKFCEGTDFGFGDGTVGEEGEGLREKEEQRSQQIVRRLVERRRGTDILE